MQRLLEDVSLKDICLTAIHLNNKTTVAQRLGCIIRICNRLHNMNYILELSIMMNYVKLQSLALHLEYFGVSGQ